MARAAEERDVLVAHGFHSLRVKEVRPETADSRSLVLDVPDDLAAAFTYRAGQFCTFRVHVEGEELLRSYSMSSAPEVDADLTVTVKRVPGGRVSNWLIDRVVEGDTLETTRPAGVFCLRDASPAPIVAFCGGSGVTPVMSLAKTALAATSRAVRVLYANRNRESVIFREELDRLGHEYGHRLRIRHHFDCEDDFLDASAVRRFLRDAGPDPDVYICGPEPFMDLVEATLLSGGTDPGRIFIERFGVNGPPAVIDGADIAAAGPAPTDRDIPESVTIILKGRKVTVPYKPGDTVLETARRGGLRPPFSCESGTCATCMAVLREGSATMRVNHALTAEEVGEGWILTCQSLPAGGPVTVEYEAL